MDLNRRTPPISAALLVFLGVGAPMTYGQAPPDGGGACSVLTPIMLREAFGQPVTGKPEAQKALPMYGGASGWNCTYSVGEPSQRVKVEFTVYTEASAAKAKQDFNTYSNAADVARGKPSIGDGAYWVEPTKRTLALYVLKGKVHFSLQAHFSLDVKPANEKQLSELAAAVAASI